MPTRPASFDVFDGAVPTFSTLAVQTFASFVQGIPSTLDPIIRGHFDGFSVSSVTPTLLNAIRNESDVKAHCLPEEKTC